MNKYEIFEDKEQLARIIAFELCPQKYHKEWYGEEARCYADNNFSDCIKIKEVVDKIYNAGYRKVGEDEIVESMKTYDRARQETAREILQELEKMFGTSREFNWIDIGTAWETGSIGNPIRDKLERVANEYGIELED